MLRFTVNSSELLFSFRLGNSVGRPAMLLNVSLQSGQPWGNVVAQIARIVEVFEPVNRFLVSLVVRWVVIGEVANDAGRQGGL